MFHMPEYRTKVKESHKSKGDRKSKSESERSSDIMAVKSSHYFISWAEWSIDMKLNRVI